jgi:chitodextrinase
LPEGIPIPGATWTTKTNTQKTTMKTPDSCRIDWRGFAATAFCVLCFVLPAVQSARAAEINDNTPPTVPTGLTATTVSCSEISLTWQASTDQGGSASVRGYRIYRNRNFVMEVAAANTSFLDVGLSPSATYSYSISATDTAGNESVPSEAATATTLVCGDHTPPTVPGGLTATAFDCTSVALSWAAAFDPSGSGVRGYRIWRNDAFVTEVAAPNTTFLDVGLSENHTYSYRVSAKDRSDNESGQSAEAVAALVPCNDAAPPSVPTGLTANAVDCSRVQLAWNATTDVGGSGVRGYRILRNGALIIEVPDGTTTFLDAGLSPVHAYSYTISATDRSNNESASSAAVAVTTPVCDSKTSPSVPTAVFAVPAACTQINLNWSPSTDLSGAGLRGYKIFRNGSFVTELGASSTAFADTSVSSLRTYAYKVSAVDKAGNESAQSDPANVTTPSCGLVFKGDFDQDRQTDVVLQHTDGSVAFWTMSGTTIRGGSVPYVLPAGWQIVAAGDFNHDDQSDFVLQHTDRSVGFWLMRGTTIAEGIVPFQLPEGWRIVATGDFNNDTQMDLVLQNVDGLIGFWFMDGTTVVSSQLSYQVPAGWRVAGTGRFDHNASTDMVLQHNDGSVAFWLMDGTTLLSGFVAYQIPAAWQIVATGNYNSDSDTDIVLQNTDGSVAFWLMNGTEITQAPVPYVLPAGWQIVGPR